MEGAGTKQKAMSQSPFEVSEDSLGSYQMSVCGRMHELTDLVNSKIEIRSGEGKVL